MKEVNNIFVPIGGGDENLSIGAAQYLYSTYSNSNELKPINTPYLSATFFKDDINNMISSEIIKKDYIVKKILILMN